MKVLFLNPAGGLGGGERCLLDLMASIRAHAPRVELGLIAGTDGPLLEQVAAMGAQVIRLPLGGHLANLGDSQLAAKRTGAVHAAGGRLALGALSSARYVGRLRRAIRDFEPSVIHSNGIKMHVLAAAARTRAPLVWHIRDFIGERPLVPLAMRAVGWRADAGIAISRAVCDDAARVLARPPLSVVYDAIDTDAFAPPGRVANLDTLAGRDTAPAGCVRVGLVGTYARWKGQDLFLEAARLVQSARGAGPIQFYIVGGPIYDSAGSQFQPDELRALARRLGVEDSVRFVPFQARIDEVYRALDVVVHASSRREPFGRTIAEGMATGRAVIVSRGSGASELFVDGTDAVGVAPRDPRALADAVRALAGDPVERERLGRAARATAVARFSRDCLARQVFGVYRAAGVEGAGLARGDAEGGAPNWTMVSEDQKR